MDRHIRWFRRLLRLLPPDFQADYGRDMERTFRAQGQDAVRERGATGVASLWWETIQGFARTAPREHFDQMRQDVIYGLRNLRRRPVVTLAAVSTLAIGIGGVTAILSIVNGVDWRPLGYPRPEQVIFLREKFKGEAGETTGYLTFADWRERSRSFAYVAAMSSASTTLSGVGEPEQLSGIRVTPDFFRAIGIAPAIGRAFTEAENRWDNRRFVILSDRLWRERFSSDPNMVGRAIQLGGRPHVVTGVMPRQVEDLISERGLASAEDFWMPLGYDRTLPFACRTCRHIRVVGRLRSGVPLDQAAAELDEITAQLAREHPSE